MALNITVFCRDWENRATELICSLYKTNAKAAKRLVAENQEVGEKMFHLGFYKTSFFNVIYNVQQVIVSCTKYTL